MTTVIGVKFRNNNKAYWFSPGDIDIKRGDGAVVETARGIEFGEVVMGKTQVDDSALQHPLKQVIRKATEEDLRRVESNRRKEKEAFPVAQRKIAEHNLEMKLVDVEYSLEENKVLFYFTADGRIDFRELVKDLAGVFRTRIELRQIGVRDESKMLGGLGICGKTFCCTQFLSDFQPVSIKMAKEQGLSLNPAKISGACGRLMCCLKYEQEVYDELLSITPHHGCTVQTPDGPGRVVDSYPLTGNVKVVLSADPPGAAAKTYKREDLTVIAGKGPRKPSGQDRNDEEPLE